MKADKLPGYKLPNKNILKIRIFAKLITLNLPWMLTNIALKIQELRLPTV